MNSRTLSDDDLRYWLKNEDWYMSRHTREWLTSTPPEVAADMLAFIAADAKLESRSPLLRFVSAVAVAGFSPSGALAGKGPGTRKAGIRAALMLADLGDKRALVPLLRVFETNPSLRSQYQPLIETSLKRLLENLSERDQTDVAADFPDTSAQVERIWQSGGVTRDLSSSATELLVTVLPLFRTADGMSQNPILREIAESPANGANRLRVQEMARTLVQ